MSGFEKHGKHLAPELHCGDLLEQLQFPARRLLLVACIRFLEPATPSVVQIGHVRWREQRPVTAFHHPLHEQVGNPIGCVHVVSATAIVAGVLAQLEEFLDVEMPGLEIRADRTLTFASVVRESGRRHVRLVGIDLEIDHDRAHHHRFDGAHAGEYRAAVSDPVAFADGLATHQRGDLWHRGDAQIVGVGRAAECRLGAIPAARPMPISAHAALTASRHAQPQELVAQSFGQRVRRFGGLS